MLALLLAVRMACICELGSLVEYHAELGSLVEHHAKLGSLVEYSLLRR